MNKKDIAIRVAGVSKLYRLGSKDLVYDSLVRTVFDFLANPIKNYRKYKSLYDFSDVDMNDGAVTDSSVIWALKDVSFEVKPGEVVGIIGTNGAGKSTLLKILSRITPPSKGTIRIRGRVGSMLEVGTGFHRELTGRENVYLNGTILGMTKREVDQKFDEIIEFSGIEKFLDTPVKRYSSGMKVRLAFAVAAHLEAEILLIDEVLAVGDAKFQKKCIKKMEDVGRQGKLILFVSHNMTAVASICDRSILIDNGQIIADGSSSDVIANYLKKGSIISSERIWPNPKHAPGGDVARLHAVRVISRNGDVVRDVDIRQDVGIQIVFNVLIPGFVLLPQYRVYNEDGVVMFTTFDQDPNWRQHARPVGKYVSTAWIPGNFLSSGTFLVDCYVYTRNPDKGQIRQKQVIAFNVTERMGDDTARGDWGGNLAGVVRPLLEWNTDFIPVE